MMYIIKDFKKITHYGLAFSLAASFGLSIPSFGQSETNPPIKAQYVNWSNLNLNASQYSDIQQLESEWKIIYSQYYPKIMTDRQRLRTLLMSKDKVDSQKVMALQSRILENEEKLRIEATRIYLQKKNCLNINQKKQLENMMVAPH